MVRDKNAKLRKISWAQADLTVRSISSLAVTFDHNLTYFSYFMLANAFLIKKYERQFRKF